MLKIALTASVTAIACFAISVTTGLGAGTRSEKVVELAPGDSFTLSAIGWACDYGGASPKTSLSCTPGPPGTASQGEPVVSIQRSRVVLFGTTRPALETLNTPKCCLRIWKFPATRRGVVVTQSDIDLVSGNSVSIPSIDLLCRVLASDPDHHDPGPVFYCYRQSVTSAKTSTASIEASRFHMKIAESGSNKWAYTVTRSP